MTELVTTDYIVLRKIAYGENSLIVTGISPDYGCLGFLVRRGNAGQSRIFPELELFRLLRVEFSFAQQGDLHRLTAVEQLEDFGALATRYESYLAASWLAVFCLSNVMPLLPHPHFFNAVEVGLRRLAEGRALPDAILAGASMAFLFEEGWLGHALTTEQAREQCRQILVMAAGGEGPNLSAECWSQQFTWTKELLLYNECKLP